MLVPGSLVTSLTLHSHPRSRGERSGSERSEKERNEPREMGCEGSMSVARCGGKDTKGRAATHHLLHSFRGPCPSLPPPLFAPVPYGPFATRGEKDTSGEGRERRVADSRAEKKGQQREPVRRQTETGNRHPTVVTCRSPFTSSLHLSPLLTLVPRNGVKRMRGECNETNRRWTKWTRMERTSERQEASNDRGSLRPSFCRSFVSHSVA